MANTRVVIAGFSGRLARLITTKVLEKPNIEIVGICRDHSKVDPNISSNSRVTIHEADASNFAALREALQGATTCVCCYLGEDSLMIQGQKTLIEACIAEQVPRYFASDYSFDFRNLQRGELLHKDCQIEIHEHLQRLDKSEKIKPVHILNGAFTEAFISGYMGILDPQSKKLQYWGSGDETWEITSMENTADFTAEAIADPNATGVLRVQGDSTSALHLGRTIEDVYDVKLNYERLGSLDDLYKALQKGRSERPNEPFTWLGLAYQYYIINGQTLMRGSDNDSFPAFQPETLKELLKKHNFADLPDIYTGSTKIYSKT